MINIIFILIVIILAVVLYRMLSQAEKTYAYSRTMQVSYRPDGTEQIRTQEESGIIFIGKKTITIDGESYVYKSSDRSKIQARLNFEGGGLKSIHLGLKDGGEKLFYVDKIKNAGDLKMHYQ